MVDRLLYAGEAVGGAGEAVGGAGVHIVTI
jgi:hypothetical protein